MMRPNVVLFVFPLFSRHLCCFGVLEPKFNMTLCLFRPPKSPFYTPKHYVLKGPILIRRYKTGEKRQKDKWLHFHACYNFLLEETKKSTRTARPNLCNFWYQASSCKKQSKTAKSSQRLLRIPRSAYHSAPFDWVWGCQHFRWVGLAENGGLDPSWLNLAFLGHPNP